jgi:transcriptional regulator with XRE-family HTH domain
VEQVVGASLPNGSFGALLRACRRRAHLSQEQLAERAKLSERTVRNLEAGRVRSPRNDTVRLLADALKLTETEREGWFDAARCLNGWRAEPAILEVRGLEGGSNSWRNRSFTTGFRVEVVCEFAVRMGPGQARPFERPVMADDELLKASQSPAQAQLSDDDSAFSRCETELARIEAVLTGDARDAFCLEVTCLIDRAGKTLLAVQCAYQGAARCPAHQMDVAVCPARQLSPGHSGCLFLVGSRHQLLGLATRDEVHRITLDKPAPAR